MSTARQNAEWERQSHLMALIANLFGGKQKPADFNPFTERVAQKGRDTLAKELADFKAKLKGRR